MAIRRQNQGSRRAASFKNEFFHLNIRNGITLTLKRLIQEHIFMQMQALVCAWNPWIREHTQKPGFFMKDSRLMILGPTILNTENRGNLASKTSQLRGWQGARWNLLFE